MVKARLKELEIKHDGDAILFYVGHLAICKATPLSNDGYKAEFIGDDGYGISTMYTDNETLLQDVYAVRDELLSEMVMALENGMFNRVYTAGIGNLSVIAPSRDGTFSDYKASILDFDWSDQGGGKVFSTAIKDYQYLTITDFVDALLWCFVVVEGASLST